MSCSPSFFAALLVRCSVCVGVRNESETGKGEGNAVYALESDAVYAWESDAVYALE